MQRAHCDTWGQGAKSGRTKGMEGEGSDVGKGRIGRGGRVKAPVVVAGVVDGLPGETIKNKSELIIYQKKDNIM